MKLEARAFVDRASDEQRQPEAMELRLAEDGDDVPKFRIAPVLSGRKTCLEINCPACAGARLDGGKETHLAGSQQIPPLFHVRAQVLKLRVEDLFVRLVNLLQRLFKFLPRLFANGPFDEGDA
jgi:hypothetical protein